MIEVWAEELLPQDGKWPAYVVGVHRRYSTALDAWCEHRRLTAAEQSTIRLHSSGAWSVKWLDRNGRADEATERLAAAGVDRRDLPRLRQAAQRWVG